ncbi:MAG: hypothetical protein Q9221_006524 [Calogaya cf. arnoldii]
MFHISSLSIGITLALYMISLFESSYANICVIGNTTALEIGIHSFNISLLSPQPLTWTLATQAVKNQGTTVERDFLLGSPPSTNLQGTNSSRIQACSLFFEGVANRLRFPGTDPEYDQGTCDDAFTAACVSDLRKQSQDELTKIMSNEAGDNFSNNSSTCDTLGNALRDRAPTSCAVATNRAWGNVLARSLTNSTTAPPISQGKCHPTTGVNYDLASIAVSRIEIPTYANVKLQSALFGVTPIMTVAYSDKGADVEIDLTCLKTIGPKAMKVTERKSGAPVLGFSSIAVLLLAIAQSYFLYL